MHLGMVVHQYRLTHNKSVGDPNGIQKTKMVVRILQKVNNSIIDYSKERSIHVLPLRIVVNEVDMNPL